MAHGLLWIFLSLLSFTHTHTEMLMLAGGNQTNLATRLFPASCQSASVVQVSWQSLAGAPERDQCSHHKLISHNLPGQTSTVSTVTGVSRTVRKASVTLDHMGARRCFFRNMLTQQTLQQELLMEVFTSAQRCFRFIFNTDPRSISTNPTL